MTDVLLITPVVPDPEGDGRARRAHQWLTMLGVDATVSVIVARGAAAGLNSISAAALDENGGMAMHELAAPRPRWLRALRALCAFLPKPVNGFARPPEWVSCRRGIRRELEGWRASAGVGKFEHIFCFRLYLSEIAAALARIEKRWSGVSPVIELDLDDIESETNRELAALALTGRHPARAALFAASARAYRRAEINWLPRFDRVAVCCAEDQAAIKHRSGTARTRIVSSRRCRRERRLATAIRRRSCALCSSGLWAICPIIRPHCGLRPTCCPCCAGSIGDGRSWSRDLRRGTSCGSGFGA